MKFIVSDKSSQNGTILIITDVEVFGKKHEQGRLQLDLENKFYHGTEKNEKEVLELIKSAYILHLTGTAAVGLALKQGLIEKGKWITVKGIPHAEVVLG